MNWIDIGIVALLLYQAAAGFRNGFRRGLLDLAALLAAIAITITQFTYVSDLIRDITSAPPLMARWLSFFGCFFVSILLLNGGLHVTGRFIRKRRHSWPDKAVGFCLGSCRGIILVSFLLTVFTMMPIPGPISTQIDQSPLAPSALAIVPMVYDSIASRVLPGSRPYIEHLNQYLALPSARTSSISLDAPESLLQMLKVLFQEPR